MRIGDLVLHQGRRVILLGVEPMSVPDRSARVQDADTGAVFDVPYAELEPAEGFPSMG
jgi:hypothetical protein